MVRRESPRTRRLRTDFKALSATKAESSILDFQYFGVPADVYKIRFQGRGLWRPDGAIPQIREQHEVAIRLGASYPRMMPELKWQTPIFHPNISASGVVCLGGYGTHWVPSLNLDELCQMLWDMIRYKNLDVESPYNREAASWVKTQKTYAFPIDARPLRDRLAGAVLNGSRDARSASGFGPAKPNNEPADVVFLDSVGRVAVSPNAGENVEIVEAELVDVELVDVADSGIMFIE